MSVRMMVEVLDHAPRELPDVQHRTLVALAERMNDATRTGLSASSARSGACHRKMCIAPRVNVSVAP